MASSSSGSTGERSLSSPHNKIPEQPVAVVRLRSLDSTSFWKAGELGNALVLRKYLTSRIWAFEAIAQLIDNAVDEINNGASFVKVDRIYNKRDNSPALLFQDDGGGMSPDSLRKCMSLGYSMKKANTTIGQYGNGFKTSTMRLGADVIVFSRSSLTSQATQSVGLLSYTFLLKTWQDDVIVPMVDFDVSNHWAEPIIYGSQDDWSSNLKMILEWSPFASKDELLQQFEDIGSHGTKIIIYNLCLNDEGVSELSFDDDDEDIRLRDEISRVALTKASKKAIETQAHISYQIRFSLRAYASMLYLRKFENFKIILRGKPVEQYNIADELRHPKVVTYRPHVSTALKEPTVETTLGFVKEFPAISISGFNVYNKNRLIRPFWKVTDDGNSFGIGVVGVLEANFIEPAHNKQDFERSSLYHRLEMGLKQMQLEYWRGHCCLVGHRPLDKKTSARTLQKDISVSAPVELNRNVQQNFLSENAIGLSANAHSSRAEAMLPAPIGQEDSRKVSNIFRDDQDQVKLQEQDQVKLQKQVDTIKKECRGFPLMEVFNIIYLSRDEVKPEEQHGTIKLICESGFQYLYNVPDVGVDTAASKPSVKYKDDILVTLKGPTSFGDALLKFDLFSGAYKGTIELRWYHEMLFRSPVFFEEIRIQSRDGTGEIVVHTGQFANAIVASLEVKLLNNVAATNVYGVVVASNSKLDRANCTSVLFVKKEDYKIQVGPDGVIPLSKSCIAVPLDSVLYVDFSLHVNGQCYTATVPFNAGNTGDVEGYNSKNDPMIRVKVNWDASRDTRNKFYDQTPYPTDFSMVL